MPAAQVPEFVKVPEVPANTQFTLSVTVHTGELLGTKSAQVHASDRGSLRALRVICRACCPSWNACVRQFSSSTTTILG